MKLLWLLALGTCSFVLPLHAAPTTASAPAKEHWSLKPVQRPSVPTVADSSWQAHNPIDNFIFAKLAQEKLSPSPEAPRRTLIRRLYLDLIGLPPTPEQVAAFEQATAPDAYEKLVETLLASPQYGERWARHWLDVVRFAETTGFEVNVPRPNAWPYRDYVIRAFNEDKPYNRFVLEQFAGDLFGEDAATGFLVAGPWDAVKSPDPVLTANQRADELHDMVGTTGSAFLGLTIGCARCHDHKFDPIPQKEYYALKACLAGVQHGERKLASANLESREREIQQTRQALVELDSKLAAFEPLACAGKLLSETIKRAPVNARRNVERFTPVAAKYLRFTVLQTSGAEPCIDELEVYTAEPKPRNVALASLGTKARASSVYPNSEIHRIEHINDGQVGNSHSWISNERGQGWIELEFPEAVTLERVVWGRDREQKFKDRLPTEYRIEVAQQTAPASLPARPPALELAGKEAGAPSSNAWHLVAASVDRQPYVPDAAPSPEARVAGLSPEAARQATALLAEQVRLEARLTELSSVPMVYAGTFTSEPPPVHRFNRGDPMQEREIIEPSVLGVIPVRFVLEAKAPSAGPPSRRAGLRASETGPKTSQSTTPLIRVSSKTAAKLAPTPLPSQGEGATESLEPTDALAEKPYHSPTTPDQRRRLALAQWIADPGNPLPARVMVNRLWLYHFGEGIVSTPSDFGVNGARPSHLELLNWLAAEFISPTQTPGESSAPLPWSLKHIQRLIVTSATYRQASAARTEGLAADAAGRLLWRFPPQRLEAEPLRDSILAISGCLDLRAGGPGFSAFEPNDNYVRVYNPKKEFGPPDWRRMVYMTKVRMQQDGTFGAFDCPDGGQIAPKRMRSTTPLQALNLLNSEFMMQQAGRFAARLEHDAGADVSAQVPLAFALAYSRAPDAPELSVSEKFIQEQGLALFCRAVFNSNEFIFME